MSSEQVDYAQVRRDIHDALTSADSPPERARLVDMVSTLDDHPEDVVGEELDRLEAAGFVYLVGDGGSAEVKVA